MKLPSRRAVAFAVTVVLSLVGVSLWMGVASRPTYEATARFTVGLADPAGLHVMPSEDWSGPDLAEERRILLSAAIVDRARELVATKPIPTGPDGFASFVQLREGMILDDLHIKTSSDDNQITVGFRTDEFALAGLVANQVVEAYRQVRPDIQFPVGCLSSSGCLPLDPVRVTSISSAQTQTTRIDRPDGADVSRFLLVSLLAVYLAWKWWPEHSRDAEFEDTSGR